TIQERAHHIQNPAMIIVGEVVKMREKINWFVEQATVQNETLTEMSST
ncbi:MAG: uroporphyrin-III C-methyltransferase, partial [Staphylococcus epidermidis]|nr:uroporphyrin-III C-methyltransferase [Staphylococcus epidermidis]MDU1641646.1 uroporphyrin-III C-methyltransferase [Staphylococcus epidermidis]